MINTLNDIFGQGNWGYDIADGYPKCVKEESVEIRGKRKNIVSYISKVEFYAVLERGKNKDGSVDLGDSFYSGRNHTARFTEVGFGNGQDAYSMGAAHELASKESVTDAVKRAAKNLGMRMGLALYDKSQEFVEETPAPSSTKSKTTKSDAMALITAKSKVIVSRGLKTADELRAHLKKSYSVSKKEDLTAAQADKFLIELDNVLNMGGN